MALQIDTRLVKHEIRVMKNVTISMKDDTLTWVRVKAAEAGQSVSRWLATLIEELRAKRLEQDDAMRRLLAMPALNLEPMKRPFSREEFYDEVLHRHERLPVSERLERAGEVSDLRGVAEVDPGSWRGPDKPSGDQ
jgi:hypothetical protein